MIGRDSRLSLRERCEKGCHCSANVARSGAFAQRTATLFYGRPGGFGIGPVGSKPVRWPAARNCFCNRFRSSVLSARFSVSYGSFSRSNTSLLTIVEIAHCAVVSSVGQAVPDNES